MASLGYAGLYGGWSSTILRDCPFSAIYWYVFETIRPKYAQLFSEQGVAVSAGSEGDRRVKKSGGEFSVFPTFCSGASAGMLAALCTHPYDVIKTQQQMAVMNAKDSVSTNEAASEKIISKVRHSSARHTDALVGRSHTSAAMANCHSSQLHCLDNNSKRLNMSSNKSNTAVSSGANKSQQRPLSSRLTLAVSSQQQQQQQPQITLRYLYSNGGVSALYRGLSMRLVSVIPASAIMVTIYEKIKSIEFGAVSK
jgi:hypothetical protein